MGSQSFETRYNRRDECDLLQEVMNNASWIVCEASENLYGEIDVAVVPRKTECSPRGEKRNKRRQTSDANDEREGLFFFVRSAGLGGLKRGASLAFHHHNLDEHLLLFSNCYLANWRWLLVAADFSTTRAFGGDC